MLGIKKLEMDKLIKELDYLKSDYTYKSELIKEADIEFTKSIESILDINSELKDMYHDSFDDKHKEADIINNIIPEEDYIDDRSDKIKKLYREIAKNTHPDKIINKKLNNIYIEASKYYDSNDLIGIYKICNEMSIDYDIDVSDIDIIKSNIKLLKEKIIFLESGHVWNWYIQDYENKNKMVLDFIKRQIIK